MPPIATNDPIAWSTCLSVRLSVRISFTLVHPVKVVGRNEMPFGRDTDVVPCITFCYTGAPVSPREGEILGTEPLVRSVVTCRLITPAIFIRYKRVIDLYDLH